jgi:anthranilate synthase component II
MKVLVADNHDSFTYNLVQMIRESGAEPVVKYTEDITLHEINGCHKLLVSPGPGLPSGKLKKLLKESAPHTSVLGICLGHQAAAEAFGGKLKHSDRIYHGESVAVYSKLKDYILFKDIPEVFSGGRYHSWIVDKGSLPVCFEVTALDDNNEIMGLHHKEFNLHTLQFHPESILTPEGNKIIFNWLNE